MPAGMPAGGGAGGPTPQQMAAMFQGLSGEDRARLAQQFGLTPDQFAQFAEMMGQMSPEQLQQVQHTQIYSSRATCATQVTHMHVQTSTP